MLIIKFSKLLMKNNLLPLDIPFPPTLTASSAAKRGCVDSSPSEGRHVLPTDGCRLEGWEDASPNEGYRKLPFGKVGRMMPGAKANSQTNKQKINKVLSIYIYLHFCIWFYLQLNTAFDIQVNRSYLQCSSLTSTHTTESHQ